MQLADYKTERILQLFITSFTSLINNEKSMGPKCDPCGTPVGGIIMHLDFMPLAKTNCF